MISVDTKKKELIGDFKNAGREWQPAGEIEHAVSALKIPLSFYHEVHLLRAHIDMVRRHLGIDASTPPDARTSNVAG